MIGFDGGYVRDRHGAEERRFEVVAGKVIDAHGAQHRFAFTRCGQESAAEAFRRALAAAGVGADTPAAVLCDGDAGLWRLQREVLPGATVALDWWHTAVRFEHALQAARGLGAGTADAPLAHEAVRDLGRAKWCLWHGRWPGCRRRLAALRRWTTREHVGELLGYLERNRRALVHYAARRRRGKPISTAFVERAVNTIVAKCMNKAQQMRWSRATMHPFLDVRTAVLNDTIEDAFMLSSRFRPSPYFGCSARSASAAFRAAASAICLPTFTSAVPWFSGPASVSAQPPCGLERARRRVMWLDVTPAAAIQGLGDRAS